MTPRRDRVLIDRRLYLPEQSWTADPDRCAEAGVPPQVTFQTRPQQVQEMIEAARAAGVPFAWFTADEEFGQNPGLCAWLEHDRLVLAYSQTEVIWNPLAVDGLTWIYVLLTCGGLASVARQPVPPDRLDGIPRDRTITC